MERMNFRELTNQMLAFYTQSNYADALTFVEQNLDSFPEQAAHTTFWRMCLLSLLGRAAEVMSVFREGLDSGLWWDKSLFLDPDLNAVRDLPQFQRLAEESGRKCAEMQMRMEPARTVLVPENVKGQLPLLISLHGRNGNKDSNLEYWDVACRRGWLVLSPQSRQALLPGSYCWDNNEKGLEDILFHVEEILKAYDIDRQRIVIAGFSQGSGMGIYAALSGKLNARGFIGVGTFMVEPDSLMPLASEKQDVRGYFVVGEKDNTLDKTRAIQSILKENNIPFAEEVYPDLGHEFPSDFEKTFDQAIDFNFKED